jgi:RNA-splicing ligase RtcB
MKTNYFTDKNAIENKAIDALKIFENRENIENIAVFPDIHFCAERSIPVGVAFKTQNVFYPLITGKDMGCGVAYLKVEKKDYLKPFDNKKHYRAFERESRTMTDEGLGGGNHFLSIEESEKYLYIIVHTGSRNLGIHMYQTNLLMLSDYNPGKDWLPLKYADSKYKESYSIILRYAAERRHQFLIKTLAFLQKNYYVAKDAKFFFEDSHHNAIEFTEDGVIHRKGSTHLSVGNVVIPLSMTRGSLIVKANSYHKMLSESLFSCSHGAGRLLSRTDTLKHWHSLKKTERESYLTRFPELANNGKFENSLIEEFDFAYKKSDDLLETQPYLIKVDQTIPIATVKFIAV